MKQETAVEWLYNTLIVTPIDQKKWEYIYKQAKEMEKKQIMDAYNKNLTGLDMLEQEESGLNWAEQYYNETYN